MSTSNRLAQKPAAEGAKALSSEDLMRLLDAQLELKRQLRCIFIEMHSLIPPVTASPPRRPLPSLESSTRVPSPVTRINKSHRLIGESPAKKGNIHASMYADMPSLLSETSFVDPAISVLKPPSRRPPQPTSSPAPSSLSKDPLMPVVSRVESTLLITEANEEIKTIEEKIDSKLEDISLADVISTVEDVKRRMLELQTKYHDVLLDDDDKGMDPASENREEKLSPVVTEYSEGNESERVGEACTVHSKDVEKIGETLCDLEPTIRCESAISPLTHSEQDDMNPEDACQIELAIGMNAENPDAKEEYEQYSVQPEQHSSEMAANVDAITTLRGDSTEEEVHQDECALIASKETAQTRLESPVVMVGASEEMDDGSALNKGAFASAAKIAMYGKDKATTGNAAALISQLRGALKPALKEAAVANATVEPCPDERNQRTSDEVLVESIAALASDASTESPDAQNEDAPTSEPGAGNLVETHPIDEADESGEAVQQIETQGETYEAVATEGATDANLPLVDNVQENLAIGGSTTGPANAVDEVELDHPAIVESINEPEEQTVAMVEEAVHTESAVQSIETAEPTVAESEATAHSEQATNADEPQVCEETSSDAAPIDSCAPEDLHDIEVAESAHGSEPESVSREFECSAAANESEDAAECNDDDVIDTTAADLVDEPCAAEYNYQGDIIAQQAGTWDQSVDGTVEINPGNQVLDTESADCVALVETENEALDIAKESEDNIERVDGQDLTLCEKTDRPQVPTNETSEDLINKEDDVSTNIDSNLGDLTTSDGPSNGEIYDFASVTSDATRTVEQGPEETSCQSKPEHSSLSDTVHVQAFKDEAETQAITMDCILEGNSRSPDSFNEPIETSDGIDQAHDATCSPEELNTRGDTASSEPGEPCMASVAATTSSIEEAPRDDEIDVESENTVSENVGAILGNENGSAAKPNDSMPSAAQVALTSTPKSGITKSAEDLIREAEELLNLTGVRNSENVSAKSQQAPDWKKKVKDSLKSMPVIGRSSHQVPEREPPVGAIRPEEQGLDFESALRLRMQRMKLNPAS